jgi:hypothetical protein
MAKAKMKSMPMPANVAMIDGATALLESLHFSTLCHGHVPFDVLWAGKYRWNNLNLRSSINFV